MSIELKYKINYHITLVLLGLSVLIFGAVGILCRIKGIIMIPLISAFLATILCVEKRRVTSVAVAVLLLAFEIYYGSLGYFTVISLSSVILAIIIALCYTKEAKKSHTALYATAFIAISIVLLATLYILGNFKNGSVSDVVDNFLIIYNNFKEKTIADVMSVVRQSAKEEEMFSTESLNLLFDTYLNLSVALVSILSFLIVGITLKVFSRLIRSYSRNPDKINQWDFMPSAPFAYFYFVNAILSLFVSKSEDALSISIMNLHLIFMFVFAYVGYKFITTIISSNGRNPLFTSFAVLAVTVLFSSFAIQILAISGAFVSVNYDKISKNGNFTNDNPFNE